MLVATRLKPKPEYLLLLDTNLLANLIAKRTSGTQYRHQAEHLKQICQDRYSQKPDSQKDVASLYYKHGTHTHTFA